jgi:hypothetical protein
MPSKLIEKLLSKYRNVDDFVHEGVLFKTNVPWVAPKAYLHILFPRRPWMSFSSGQRNYAFRMS